MNTKGTGLEGPMKLLSIDAWRDDTGWTWNNHFLLEDGIFMTDPTPRKVLRLLRQWGYLSQDSRGKCRVDMGGAYMDTFIEVQVKSTGEPILALSMIH